MTQPIPIGSAHIACPCGQVIPVPVTSHLETDDDGRQVLICDPDMSDLWAHSWTHSDEEDDE